MRLSKIKLAGFKSFVDPTTIQFPSNMTGIVGPNGCGKSNVIDAVRWVMGESSAKHLRGDSMTDVIFNGSSARKPVGSASIELVFDNADGAIGGQYAQYAEISVRRSLSRDGTSQYYLNNTRCRRKDITQVFLGTGLGPRSYAIIEQGMISRLIEAKPEDMRAFLEEAAGISRYKDRRRETENRIRHTRENLSRLEDLREEVEKQIRHLERQARTAARFKEMKQAERRLQAELLVLRMSELETREGRARTDLGQRETELQSALAEQRQVEAGIETLRARHAEEIEAVNAVQGRYYKIGAEIARLEQTIQHGKELRQRQQNELAQAEHGLRDMHHHIERDELQLEDLTKVLGELGPGLERAQLAESASADALRAAEDKMRAWQERWEAFTRDAGDTRRESEVERARIEQLEGQLHRIVTRRERIGEEQTALRSAMEASDLEDIAAAAQEQRDHERAAQAELDATLEELARVRERDRELGAGLDRQRQALQECRGQLGSLEALQEAALGQRSGQVVEWLSGRGLEAQPRLAQQLRVEPGWERAVETVLGAYLEAVCVDGLDGVTAALDSLTHGAVSFLESGIAGAGQTPSVGDNPLGARVRGPAAVSSLLAGVRTAESLAEALSVRHSLAGGESVITPDGIWLGTNWLRVSREEDPKAGVISREDDIRVLRGRIGELGESVDALGREHLDAQARQKALDARRDELQQRVNETHRQHASLNARLENIKSRLEQNRARLQKLADEGSEVGEQITELEERLRSSRQALEQALGRMSAQEDEREQHSAERERLQGELAGARERADDDRRAAQEIAIKVESRRSSMDSASVSIDRLREQLSRFSQRKDDLEQQLEEGIQPLQDAQESLSGLLEQRVSVETELGEARRAQQSSEASLREEQEKRLSRERAVESVRQGLDELKLSLREVTVRLQTIQEQFAETGFDASELKESLAEDAAIQPWEEELERLQARIQRLGPINLASIDELKEQSERKEYLDAQFTDLTDALTTLENAMRKIDRETRTRFKETFDKVNAGLKDLFPRLFGGGHAYLELGDEDLLHAGVAVMARPPGKRNSTIHLLSGGEKALTAVALVFAIFQLNPAPFCMLDEVDAPLDDANVSRYCDIVRQMSETVQFIFITHNKTTMEMSRQLTGVTMHEPGVSRLVAVDIDEAVQMAAV